MFAWPAFSLLLVACGTLTSTTELLFAQDAIASKRTMLDALRAVDSVSTKELEWVAAFVEKQLADNPRDSLANCIQSILFYRDQEFAKARDALEASVAGDAPELVRSTVAKFQLICALNLDDAETSGRLFRSLMQATQRESTSLPVRKSFSEWLGEIVGTLDFSEAKPPIDAELLAQAKKTMRGMAEISLSQAFEHHYGLAQSRADRIVQALRQWNDLGEEAFRANEKDQADQLSKLEMLLAESTKDKREFSDANLAASKMLKGQLGALRDQMRNIDREWAMATPGKPRPVPPPLLPRRELIFVDPIQIRIVVEYVNGQRIERQIQERRPIWDMEAERDLIYQGQISVYSSQNAIYQQYQKALNDWNKQDEERRKKLSDRRMEIEAQMTQLRQQIDQLEDERKENVGGNADIKKAIAQLKLDLQAMRDVMRAASLGKPELSLRTNRIDPWLIAEEKNRLLRLFQK
jgi:hypothetical protein